MSGIGNVNLKVLLLETDFYALQAINSYLAWDRRTRVTFLADSQAAMWSHLDRLPIAELPDVVILDADHTGGASALRELLHKLQARIPNLIILCLAQAVDPALVEVALTAKARAYFLKQEVRLQIAWAVVYAVEKPFVATPRVIEECAVIFRRHSVKVKPLPDKREYPELTERIRQAIKLCVIEGMPAHLAADEMGISLHTIRGYVKEGYRILESYDETEYPIDMTPQERAFMRFTALELEDESPPGG